MHGVRVSELGDTFNAARGSSRRHEAVDIAAPRGRPVYAVDDGTLVKLFKSVPGGLTVDQFDPDRRVAYDYAHLDRYADGLREGMALRRCDLIGYVGSTGNAPPDAPNLHFAVFRLGVLKQWWGGLAIDPLPALKAGAAAGRPRPSCSHSQAGSRSVRRPASLTSAEPACSSSAAASSSVPGVERVTAVRATSKAIIASRLTRPSAWFRKWVAAKTNSTSPLARRRRWAGLPRSRG